jgi:hypothetical protein
MRAARQPPPGARPSRNKEIADLQLMIADWSFNQQSKINNQQSLETARFPAP